ncbi:uncharacterized protein LOC131156446 [Malania oleifera]|uniref:uncharacterized protein LOC131156446 n=1 Tax=Malania oleifera TaxID=397392 RepID=UPI0025ADCDBF|nr:uncharacterized protein LOC131156446 [Malania oleifera]
MSEIPDAPPPFSLQGPAPPPPLQLYKQRSWSPDTLRDEAWLRRKGNNKRRDRRSKSVTDEDVDELKACIELGFGFGSGFDSSDNKTEQRLSDTLPALGFYYAVNKRYYGTVSKSTSSPSTVSDCDPLSPVGSPPAIFGPGDDPEMVKTRLRQWAQVVACSVRQSSS